MNRVTAGIEKTREMIHGRLAAGQVTQEKVDALHKSLDMPFDEYCTFQALKSVAMSHNKLTEEEAQTVYAYLGNTPDQFNEQPIQVKVILTKLFSELLTWKVSLRAA